MMKRRTTGRRFRMTTRKGRTMGMRRRSGGRTDEHQIAAPSEHFARLVGCKWMFCVCVRVCVCVCVAARTLIAPLAGAAHSLPDGPWVNDPLPPGRLPGSLSTES
eukprot:3482901-Pyramimonas_sp.AAC.2